MADKTHIEWTDATWPVVQGCDYESPGCTHCYAVPLLWRMAHHPNPKISGPLEGVVEKRDNGKLVFTGKVALREDRLDWPLKWRTPKKIFLPSHGDLFHEAVPDDFIDRVMETCGACDDLDAGHVFQLLTKRAARQRDYMCSGRAYQAWNRRRLATEAWPPRNIWCGVSVEDQTRTDERIPLLLDTPAAKRFISAEPLLNAIDLRSWLDFMVESPDFPSYPAWTRGLLPSLDWVIVGGESGPGSRPMHPDWARKIRDDCAAAGVPYFFKQWGAFAPPPHREDLPGRPQLVGAGDLFIDPDGRTVEVDASLGCELEDVGTPLRRVGKAAAGRLLDGREWSEFPA